MICRMVSEAACLANPRPMRSKTVGLGLVVWMQTTTPRQHVQRLIFPLALKLHGARAPVSCCALLRVQQPQWEAR